MSNNLIAYPANMSNLVSPFGSATTGSKSCLSRKWAYANQRQNRRALLEKDREENRFFLRSFVWGLMLMPNGYYM